MKTMSLILALVLASPALACNTTAAQLEPSATVEDASFSSQDIAVAILFLLIGGGILAACWPR